MQLLIFKYEQEDNHLKDLTTIDINGEAWFIASEVCNLLSIANTSDAVSRLDDDERQTVNFPESSIGSKKKIIISESGLYSLIFRSNKPSAKKFKKWITNEVIPTIRKTGQYGINRIETPNFIIRFNDNWDRTDKGYFSVISELFVRLYGRFEQVGYRIPDKAFDGKEIRPDVSVGKTFANHLRKNYSALAQNHKMYKHRFPSGFEVDARQYKNELLPVFIDFIDNYWIMNNAEKYFKTRDVVALDYLPKLIGK